MKGLRIPVSILLSLVFILSAFAGALAQTSTDAYPACSDGIVSGVVTDVTTDEATGVTTVTIRYTAADGTIAYCTVTLNGTYGQPIVQLLADYFGESFGDIDLGALEEALASLENLNTCVVLVPGADPGPEDDTYAWNDCSDPTAIHVTVQSSNGDGTYVVIMPDGTTKTVAIAGDAAATIDAALAALAVNWDVLGGNLGQIGDQIAMYHDMGIGFGVLVKLYSLSQASGIPIEELVASFQNGGLGVLMKSYKHLMLMGVGHVRKAYKEMTNPDDPAAPTTPGKGKGKDKDNPKKPAPKPKQCKGNSKAPGCP